MILVENPSFCIVQASLAANTFAVQGHAETKCEYLEQDFHVHPNLY